MVTKDPAKVFTITVTLKASENEGMLSFDVDIKES